MDINLSERVNQVLSSQTKQNNEISNEPLLKMNDDALSSLEVMPRNMSKKSMSKKLFIALFVLLGLLVLGTVFGLINFNKLKKSSTPAQSYMSDEEYKSLVESLEKSGFFRIQQIDDKKLEALNTSFYSDPRFAPKVKQESPVSETSIIKK